ncbi:MAG: hypothetical protein MZV64_45430 [Ignavibacteriales bacterium]|nr:hypothetical protein [Ignavibacteriales bacterium]
MDVHDKNLFDICLTEFLKLDHQFYLSVVAITIVSCIDLMQQHAHTFVIIRGLPAKGKKYFI